MINLGRERSTNKYILVLKQTCQLELNENIIREIVSEQTLTRFPRHSFSLNKAAFSVLHIV